MIARPAGCCTVTVALTAALLAVGCSRGIEDLVARPADQKAGSAAGSNQSMPPPPPPPPAKPQGVPPGPSPGELPSRQASIRLSAGVALAQTLPTGTAMGFSVDYEFTEGQPNPTSPYGWVIEPGKGPPVKFMVRLKSKDNLSIFVPKWRPENGPFQTHIEDAGGRRLSPSIPLR